MVRRFCEESNHRPPCRCVTCRRTRTCWMPEFKSPCCLNALGRTGLLRLAVRSLRPRCHARNRTKITLLLACTIAAMNLALLRTWPPAQERPTSPCARRTRRTTGSRKLRPTGPWHRQHPVRRRAPANRSRVTPHYGSNLLCHLADGQVPCTQRDLVRQCRAVRAHFVCCQVMPDR